MTTNINYFIYSPNFAQNAGDNKIIPFKFVTQIILNIYLFFIYSFVCLIAWWGFLYIMCGQRTQ